MTENPAPMRQDERLVWLIGPADHRDVTYLTQDGPVRFFEGTARVRESVAQRLLQRGWHVRP